MHFILMKTNGENPNSPEFQRSRDAIEWAFAFGGCGSVQEFYEDWEIVNIDAEKEAAEKRIAAATETLDELVDLFAFEQSITQELSRAILESTLAKLKKAVSPDSNCGRQSHE